MISVRTQTETYAHTHIEKRSFYVSYLVSRSGQCHQHNVWSVASSEYN